MINELLEQSIKTWSLKKWLSIIKESSRRICQELIVSLASIHKYFSEILGFEQARVATFQLINHYIERREW